MFDSILENPDTAHGINGIYFAENDQFAWGDLHRAAGAALFESGKIASPDPIPYTSEEIKAAPRVGSFKLSIHSMFQSDVYDFSSSHSVVPTLVVSVTDPVLLGGIP